QAPGENHSPATKSRRSSISQALEHPLASNIPGGRNSPRPVQFPPVSRQYLKAVQHESAVTARELCLPSIRSAIRSTKMRFARKTRLKIPLDRFVRPPESSVFPAAPDIA